MLIGRWCMTWWTGSHRQARPMRHGPSTGPALHPLQRHQVGTHRLRCISCPAIPVIEVLRAFPPPPTRAARSDVPEQPGLSDDGRPLVLGLKFRLNGPGQPQCAAVTAIRYFKAGPCHDVTAQQQQQQRRGYIYDKAGRRHAATAPFSDAGCGEGTWVTVPLEQPWWPSPGGQTYIAAVDPLTCYAKDDHYHWPRSATRLTHPACSLVCPYRTQDLTPAR